MNNACFSVNHCLKLSSSPLLVVPQSLSYVVCICSCGKSCPSRSLSDDRACYGSAMVYTIKRYTVTSLKKHTFINIQGTPVKTEDAKPEGVPNLNMCCSRHPRTNTRHFPRYHAPQMSSSGGSLHRTHRAIQRDEQHGPANSCGSHTVS